MVVVNKAPRRVGEEASWGARTKAPWGTGIEVLRGVIRRAPRGKGSRYFGTIEGMTLGPSGSIKSRERTAQPL